MPSVDRPPFEAHLELLGHGVLILENLTNLEQIRGEAFELIALPLKLEEREASPVRAMALEME
jgi:kynurenine formamidase